MKNRIEHNQKFLLGLLNLHIGKFYPLRKWIGIDHKGKIDEVSNLSIAYNTKDLGDRIQQTREYQHPDLEYKLNLLLDKIPQLALFPALLQPAYGLGALAFFFLTTTTYQPSTSDNSSSNVNPDDVFNYTANYIGYYNNGAARQNGFVYFDTSDIPNGATFSQGDLLMYCSALTGSETIYAYRATQLDWVETQLTWNSYKTGSAWATAGGDYTTTNGVNSPSVVVNNWLTWTASTLIQNCYDNQSKKVYLVLYTSSAYNCNAGFHSKEYETDTSLRPKLTVTYTTTNYHNLRRKLLMR